MSKFYMKYENIGLHNICKVRSFIRADNVLIFLTVRQFLKIRQKLLIQKP